MNMLQVEARIIDEARTLAQTEVVDKPIELSSAAGFFLAKMDDVSVLAAAYFVDAGGMTYKVGPKID